MTRKAIRSQIPIDVLHADHGSDFTSDHVAQVAADPHINLSTGRTRRPPCCGWP